MFDFVFVQTTESFTSAQQCVFVANLGSGIAAPPPEEVKLDRLEGRNIDWDGHGSPAPSKAAIRVARAWLDELKAVTQGCGRAWVQPLISSSAEAEVTFEWWSGNRKLTVYFADASAEYIRVWGQNIDTDMDSGELTTADEFRDLWNWLRR